MEQFIEKAIEVFDNIFETEYINEETVHKVNSLVSQWISKGLVAAPLNEAEDTPLNRLLSKINNPTEDLKKNSTCAETYPDTSQNPREKIHDPKTQIIQNSVKDAPHPSAFLKNELFVYISWLIEK